MTSEPRKLPPVDTVTDVLLGRLATRILKRRLEVLKTDNVLREAEGGYEVSGYWVNKVFHLEVSKCQTIHTDSTERVGSE